MRERVTEANEGRGRPSIVAHVDGHKDDARKQPCSHTHARRGSHVCEKLPQESGDAKYDVPFEGFLSSGQYFFCAGTLKQIER